jgi:hypothetical protein
LPFRVASSVGGLPLVNPWRVFGEDQGGDGNGKDDVGRWPYNCARCNGWISGWSVASGHAWVQIWTSLLVENISVMSGAGGGDTHWRRFLL